MRLSNPLTKGIVALGPRDAEFIYNESEGHRGHGVMLWLFDSSGPGVDFTQAEAVEWISRRLGCDRMYTHRIRRAPLALAHPYWVPAENFDVNDHVTVTAITEPGWAGLGAHLDEVLTDKMDLDRPPWEMHVFTGIEGLEGLPPRMTALAMKTHHSAVDGLGAVMLVHKLYTEPPQLSEARDGRIGPFTQARLLFSSMLAAPRGAIRFARAVSAGQEAAREVEAAQDSGLWAGPLESRRPNRFNKRPSGSATLQALVFEGDEVRRVRDAVPDTTINDILLGVVGGAQARYLAEVGEESADSLIALVPRSMRKIEEWESANQLVIMSVDMHTGVKDPLKRLVLISESARGEKARTSHIATRRVAAAVDSAPPIVTRLIKELRKARATDPDRLGAWQNIVSNIPMSVAGLSVNGAPCVGVLGTQPPIDKDCVRHFLTVATGDKLVLTVTADRAAVPDLSHYMGLIRESFDELEKAAGL